MAQFSVPSLTARIGYLTQHGIKQQRMRILLLSVRQGQCMDALGFVFQAEVSILLLRFSFSFDVVFERHETGHLRGNLSMFSSKATCLGRPHVRLLHLSEPQERRGEIPLRQSIM